MCSSSLSGGSGRYINTLPFRNSQNGVDSSDSEQSGRLSGANRLPRKVRLFLFGIVTVPFRKLSTIFPALKRHCILTPGRPRCSRRQRPEHLISNQKVLAVYMGGILELLAICATPVPAVSRGTYRNKQLSMRIISSLTQRRATHA